jgi:hypothetical protein
MATRNQLTPEDIKLLEALELGHFVKFDRLGVMAPPAIYRCAVQECFLSNAQGPAVDALRRGFKALEEGLGRETDEFKALISF